MEDLFQNNHLVVFIIACVAVISYTNFKENQRMFLLFLFAYGTAYFEVFQIPTSVVLLLIITFIFLEYLTEDEKKLSILIKLSRKVLDYLFMMFFQYHFLWFLLAFAALELSRKDESCEYSQMLMNILSILFFCRGAHLSVSQPFKVKSFTDINRTFEKNPIYAFEYHEKMQEKFDLLCAFEDKTYFQRTNSYSCFTLEYIKCWCQNHHIFSLYTLKRIFSRSRQGETRKSILARVTKRGYSTPEMQLIRTIGIARGYDKYKLSRKVFEIVYSKIFFASLKEYHRANTYLELKHYRQYLLYIYVQTVLTRIKGIRCLPLSSAFINSDIGNWSMEGLFIACLGLSFRQVSSRNLLLYEEIIAQFGLSESRILELNELYPKKFLAEDLSCHMSKT